MKLFEIVRCSPANLNSPDVLALMISCRYLEHVANAADIRAFMGRLLHLQFC